MKALFAKIGEWLTGFVGLSVFQQTNRFVFLGALITMYVALYIAFMGSVVAIATFSPLTPSGNVAAGLALLPGNIGQCMSAIGAAHVIAHVFIMKMKIIKMSASGA